MSEKKTNRQQAATQAYLESLGVTLPDDALAAPSIDSIRVGTGLRPTDWVDASGNDVPADLEFYRVDLTAGQRAADRAIAAKRREGFVALPDHSGFAMRALSDPDQEVVMMRTAERRAAWELAERQAHQRRMGTHRGRTGIINTAVTHHQELVAAPPLRS